MRARHIDRTGAARPLRRVRRGVYLLALLLAIASLVLPRLVQAQDDEMLQPQDTSVLAATIDTATTELDNDLAKLNKTKGVQPGQDQTGQDQADSDQASQDQMGQDGANADQTNRDQATQGQTALGQTNAASDAALSGAADDSVRTTAKATAGEAPTDAASGSGNSISGAKPDHALGSASAVETGNAEPPENTSRVSEANAPAVATAAVASNGAVELAPKSELAADTASLMKLANNLKSEVDKTSKDTLSVTVVREATEIEQLAHKMRSK